MCHYGCLLLHDIAEGILWSLAVQRTSDHFLELDADALSADLLSQCFPYLRRVYAAISNVAASHSVRTAWQNQRGAKATVSMGYHL